MKYLVLLVTLSATFVHFTTVFSPDAQANPGQNALREQGKKIFVERCASCHAESAEKKLPDGTTLLGRLAASQNPEARVGTRLKNPQERRAVFTYIDSLLGQKEQRK